jgi:hypothetical protein
MRVRLRNTCVVDDPAVLSMHDHVAWCGDGPDDLLKLAIDAFTAGAERNQRMVFIGEAPDLEQLRVSDRLDRAIDTGALTAAAIADVYGNTSHFDPAAQLEVFSGALDEAIGAGFAGLLVVADNTSLAEGDDDSFARWLAWEQLTDSFQDSREVLGVCYFDATRVPADRLTMLGAVHPVTHDVGGSFRLFIDDDATVLTGEVDDETIATLRRVLAVRPRGADDLVVDVSRADFIDHRTVVEFARVATRVAPIRLRGVHATLQGLCDALGLATDTVQFV